jgi:hypothetical protein
MNEELRQRPQGVAGINLSAEVVLSQTRQRLPAFFWKVYLAHIIHEFSGRDVLG